MFGDRIIIGIELFLADARIEEREKVAKELDAVKPTHVLMSAGITGRPNIDWCEDHKPETIRTNVIGTLNVVVLSLWCFENARYIVRIRKLDEHNFTYRHDI